jgi:hypothetical protein
VLVETLWDISNGALGSTRFLRTMFRLLAGPLGTIHDLPIPILPRLTDVVASACSVDEFHYRKPRSMVAAALPPLSSVVLRAAGIRDEESHVWD